jgi:excisionase family DNA binding protein
MPEKLLNIKQVQEILGLSERTIFRLIKKGEIQGFKIGREWRFTEADISAYIERQRQKSGRPDEEAA